MIFYKDIYRIVAIGFFLILLANSLFSCNVKVRVPQKQLYNSTQAGSLNADDFLEESDCKYLGLECKKNDPYQVQLTNKNIYFKDLPEELDGFRMAILTDLHIGYMNNKKLHKIINTFRKDKVSKERKKKGEKEYDVFLFLGDLINYNLNEIDENKVHILKKINLMSQNGVYSILGNHDYDGYKFFTEKTPEKGFDEKMAYVQEKFLGWKLLKDCHDTVEKNGKKIKFLGIEHWGVCSAIPNRGSLEKARKVSYSNKNELINTKEEDNSFKILLAHDPSFFDEVCDNHQDISLTLSGHTHGLKIIGEAFQKTRWSQMKNPFSKKFWKALPFSTYKCKHKYSSGLFTETKDERYLYVDPGVGYAGLTDEFKFGKNRIKIDFSVPNRSGIKPNITVITLKKRNEVKTK